MAFNNSSSSAPLNTTWANIPATYTIGQPVFVSNAGTKGSFWYYDGTRWKPQNGMALLASLDTTVSNIGSTATIVLQALLPANLWQTGDIIRVQCFAAKSGNADSGVASIYAGTAGTTLDTQLANSTWMASSGRTVDYFNDYRLESATTTQLVSLAVGYGTTSSVIASPVTISSAAANAIYVSFAIRSTGSTDTISAVSGGIWLISKAN